MKAAPAIDIERALLRDWVFVYGAPVSFITEKGFQYTAKFLLEAHRRLGIQEYLPRHTTPKTNRQTARCN